MADEFWFYNTQTKAIYKIVRFDREKGVVWLRSESGVEFDQPFNQEGFKKMGYELINTAKAKEMGLIQ